MLDDLNVIKQRDPQNALAVAASSPAQLKHDYKISFTPKKPILNVILTGMGGSAWPADFIKTWPKLKVPFLISRDYALPDFVDDQTLVIASSFSGNTEETLSALDDARDRGAQIVVQANGGKLAQKAKDYTLPFVQIPNCAQPRMASLFFYKAIVQILVAAGLIDKNQPEQLTKLAEPLTKALQAWKPTSPTSKNLAKQYAEQMLGKNVVVYAGPLMFPAAIKWKISVNENAKNTAWSNVLPEMCHNEFIGWSAKPVEKPFAVFDLFSKLEHQRTQKRFDVADRLLSGKRPAAVRVEARGESILEQMLYLVVLGEYVSLYLAILNGVNPTPVDLVEKFKKVLG